MFKIKADPTFEAVVKIPVPGAKPADLKLTFKHRTKDELRQFFEEASKAEGKSDGEILTGIIAGWSDVDADFSAEALTELCSNYQGAVTAIYEKYTEELGAARLKN